MKYPETPMNLELAGLMGKMKDLGLGAVDVTTVDLSFARAELAKQYAYLNQEPIQVSEVEVGTFNFEGESIRVRCYLPKLSTDQSTWGIYLHGGGWTFGDEDTHDGVARAFCAASQMPLASIGYSLAPGKKFPFQNKQIAHVIQELVEIFQSELPTSSDPVKLILIGDSAGANLALSVYQDYLNEKTRSQVVGMVLYYAVLSANTNLDSWNRLGDGRYGLSTKAMNWYWDQFLENSTQKTLPQVSPIDSNNKVLPPMWLLVGNLDPLLDDTLNFAEKLKVERIAHEVHVLEGYPHGFLRFCKQLDGVNQIIQKSGVAMQQMKNGSFK
jgi:acetyl esterase